MSDSVALLLWLFAGIGSLYAEISGFCPEEKCRSGTVNNQVPTTDDSLIRTGWRLSSQPQYRLDERLVELLNEQIGLELRAFYTYTSMASHFNRDDSAFPGFQRFFRHSAAEELSHAESQMDFMAKRGAPVQLGSLPAPCDPQSLADLQGAEGNEGEDDCEELRAKVIRSSKNRCDWGDPLSAVILARQLELKVWRNLADVYSQADSTTQQFLDSFLHEQIDSIKQLSDLITRLRRVQPCLGHHLIDRELLEAK